MAAMQCSKGTLGKRCNSCLRSEVESAKALPCRHLNLQPSESDDIFGRHGSIDLKTQFSNLMKVDNLYQLKEYVKMAYDLTRHLAKQILVIMISDLDRHYKPEVPHAAPVAYALTDNSVTNQQMNEMLRVVRRACHERSIYVAAECYDGAFVRLATRGEDNEPLTILQLSKDVYAEAKSMSKCDQVKRVASTGVVTSFNISELVTVDKKDDNNGEAICVGYTSPEFKIPPTPRNLDRLMKCTKQQNIGTAHDLPNTVDEHISLDEHGSPISEDPEPSSTDDTLFSEHGNDDGDGQSDTLGDDEISENVNKLHIVDWSCVLNALNAMLQLNDSSRKVRRHRKCSSMSLKGSFSSAKTMSSHFTKLELVTCGLAIESSLKIQTSMTKGDIVKAIAEHLGIDTFHPSRKQRSPRSLKMIAKKAVNKLPKTILNVTVAELLFPAALDKWRRKGPFSEQLCIQGFDTNTTWYSQPKYLQDEKRYILCFLDPEHMLTNARTKMCSSGLPQRGIKREAWVTVARDAKDNGCGLSPALVENIVDKQNCSFAVATFSSKVSKAMKNQCYTNEANFCQTMTDWFRAQDEPGISAKERHEMENRMKQFLLDGVDFGKFPPPGSHVRDIPQVFFEGMLIHCERRSQLYEFTRSGSYNPRAIGTLDNENFFGAFQDYDQKGTGVLRCDEVPLAMTTACEMFRTRLNPNRGFIMHTSKAKVYPVNELIQEEPQQSQQACTWKPPLHIPCIRLRDHVFDLPIRAVRRPKRKRSDISAMSEPARGAVGVRTERFRMNECKIPAHVREGLSLDAIEK